MKTFFILSLLAVSSCALYEEVVSPAKPKRVEVATAVPVEPLRPSTVTYEDSISKNWDYRKQLGTYTAVATSQDKKATLIILRDPYAKISSGLQVVGSKMKYREGHSVEVKVDDQYALQKVEPTDGDSIKFAEGMKFAESLKNKKLLTVEVLGEEGPKKYTFDISGLQDFFTTI
jgi:hypothetical protein